MRIVLILIAAALLLIETGRIVKPAATTSVVSSASAASAVSSAPVALDSPPKARVDFESQLKPIFKSKCMPCHFSGGQMYDCLPFDKPETIRKLGTKLFTRIKDEPDRTLIQDFLTQTP
jgi:hypothetical protein